MFYVVPRRPALESTLNPKMIRAKMALHLDLNNAVAVKAGTLPLVKAGIIVGLRIYHGRFYAKSSRDGRRARLEDGYH